MTSAADALPMIKNREKSKINMIFFIYCHIKGLKVQDFVLLYNAVV